MKRFCAFVVMAMVPVLAAAASPAKMAPLSAYRMASGAEVKLARSAAPSSITKHATILVLGAHGYVVAAQGTNGFTCLVERAWAQAFDATSFWNSKFRAPTCYNAQATRTVLPYTFERTHLALAKATEAQILARLTAEIANGTLPTLEPGAMAYMMSKHQYLNDSAKAWFPHVMFYEPKAIGAQGGADWGANWLGSPVVFDAKHHGVPEPWAVFFVPVSHWSDGSAAPSYTGT